MDTVTRGMNMCGPFAISPWVCRLVSLLRLRKGIDLDLDMIPYAEVLLHESYFAKPAGERGVGCGVWGEEEGGF